MYEIVKNSTLRREGECRVYENILFLFSASSKKKNIYWLYRAINHVRYPVIHFLFITRYRVGGHDNDWSTPLPRFASPRLSLAHRIRSIVSRRRRYVYSIFVDRWLRTDARIGEVRYAAWMRVQSLTMTRPKEVQWSTSSSRTRHAAPIRKSLVYNKELYSCCRKYAVNTL